MRILIPAVAFSTLSITAFANELEGAPPCTVAAGAPTVSVQLEAVPRAVVYADGERLGMTPIPMTRAVGCHDLILVDRWRGRPKRVRLELSIDTPLVTVQLDEHELALDPKPLWLSAKRKKLIDLAAYALRDFENAPKPVHVLRFARALRRAGAASPAWPSVKPSVDGLTTNFPDHKKMWKLFNDTNRVLAADVETVGSDRCGPFEVGIGWLAIESDDAVFYEGALVDTAQKLKLGAGCHRLFIVDVETGRSQTMRVQVTANEVRNVRVATGGRPPRRPLTGATK